jgi:beta-N-acetylhexosaminidase
MKNPIIFGCRGLVLTSDECSFFKEFPPMGFILFKRNCSTKAQVISLINSLRDAVGDKVPILIDQEGGRVQRLSPPIWNAYPPAEVFGIVFNSDEEKARQLITVNYQLIASELSELGINVNCAPVIDLSEKRGHSVIGDRALSSNPETVGLLGKAVIDGLEKGGVSGIIKHIPGHGRAEVDSHKRLPKIDSCLEDLSSREFNPFIQLRFAAAAMTGHLLFPKLDLKHPVTFSGKIINEIIRNLIKFEGLLLSDDLSMNALSGSIDNRYIKALEAGCDIGLHCNGNITEMELIAKACPGIKDAAKSRIKVFLKKVADVSDKREIPDINELKATLREGLKGFFNVT